MKRLAPDFDPKLALKVLLLIGCLWGSSLFALPPEFLVKYSKNSAMMAFSLEEGVGKPFAAAVKEEKKHPVPYLYKNLEGATLATGQGETLTSSDILYIYEPSGSLLGIIIRERYPFYAPVYNVYNRNNALIATASVNWLGTRFILTQQGNAHIEYATFYRPYFHIIGDYWYVKVERGNTIDERLIAFLGIFQTDLEFRNSELDKIPNS